MREWLKLTTVCFGGNDKAVNIADSAKLTNNWGWLLTSRGVVNFNRSVNLCKERIIVVNSPQCYEYAKKQKQSTEARQIDLFDSRLKPLNVLGQQRFGSKKQRCQSHEFILISQGIVQDNITNNQWNDLIMMSEIKSLSWVPINCCSQKGVVS